MNMNYVWFLLIWFSTEDTNKSKKYLNTYTFTENLTKYDRFQLVYGKNIQN